MLSCHVTRGIFSLVALVAMPSASWGNDDLSLDHRTVVSLFQIRGVQYVGFDTTRLHVESLSVRGILVTDRHLLKITKLENLRSLRLNTTKITNEGIKQLAQLSQLESLTLTQNQHITNDGIAHLQRLKRLHTLTLADKPFLGAEFDNTVFTTLTQLPNLSSLTIDAHKVTDDALPHLIAMTQLKELDVRYTGFSREAIRKLRESLPKCAIKAPDEKDQ